MIMAEQILTGSCLCGALRYNVSGEPAQFWHCHCSRCRKATGTGHASNLFVKGGGISWTGDTGLVKTFKLPDAKRFTRTFCAQCGGPLPREIPAAMTSLRLNTIPSSRRLLTQSDRTVKRLRAAVE
jgi:hypothetical protein